MPSWYEHALLLMREIKEKTGKIIVFTEIAALIRCTDGYVIEETENAVHLIFTIKKGKTE